MRDILRLFASRDNPRSVGKEVVHFFEREPGGLGEEEPEEDCVGEIADLKTP